MMPVLSTLLLLPSLGALAILLLSRGPSGAARARALALLASLATLALSLQLWRGFDPAAPSFQFAERYQWIPAWNVSYYLGVDGVTLLLVVLTALLTPLVVLSSFSSVEKRVPGYLASLLFLETGMLGALLALDTFLFYVFWEAMLVPMYLLIGIWGGERRIYAALKFFLYTMVGSVLMLLALVMLVYLHYQAAGVVTFSYPDLLKTPIAFGTQVWLFSAFALAFAIKVPLFPLHTWLPDAHVEAPTGGSVILAGVLLKMGTYGLVRFAFPLFPAAALAAAPYLSLLAVVGVIYGALVAMVQPDVKKLVAYSSVSHLGLVVLGICAFSPEAFEGALYQALNHGISTGALFLLVGVLYERRHTRAIADFGGLAQVVPAFAFFLLLVTFSSIGLPGTNGFVGEFLVLIGTFNSLGRYNTFLAAGAATGVVLGAVYMLWMVQRVLFGPVTRKENQELSDLSPREWTYLAPLAALILVMGFFPGPFLRTFRAGGASFLSRFEKDAVLSSLPAGDTRGVAAVERHFRNSSKSNPAVTAR